MIYVSDNIPPNEFSNKLNNDQFWQSWGAFFSDPDISVQPNPRFMNHPNWNHIITIMRIIISKYKKNSVTADS